MRKRVTMMVTSTTDFRARSCRFFVCRIAIGTVHPLPIRALARVSSLWRYPRLASVGVIMRRYLNDLRLTTLVVNLLRDVLDAWRADARSRKEHAEVARVYARMSPRMCSPFCLRHIRFRVYKDESICR